MCFTKRSIMSVLVSSLQNRSNTETLEVLVVVGHLRSEFVEMEPLVPRSLKGRRMQAVAAMLLFLLVMLFPGLAGAQQVETSLPLSQRFTINLAAGVPEYIGDASSASNTLQ